MSQGLGVSERGQPPGIVCQWSMQRGWYARASLECTRKSLRYFAPTYVNYFPVATSRFVQKERAAAA